MNSRLAPEVGESFGGFTIESVLGRGGMGTVYLATQAHLGRKAALKVIVPGLSHDEAFRERFLRESRLAAALDHPNVIPIYDAGEIDGVLYLAMRYVPGPSLQAEIAGEGPLRSEQAINVAEQVGSALDAAHAAGLVHRDVKPANILVADAGEHLYLCDFGLARETSSTGATRTGSFFGTVDYAAPEQIQGGPIDGRADLYALGCVLFHCMASRPPYVRESDFAVLQAHLLDEPPQLSAIRTDLSPAVDDVIAKALAKDPTARYASAAALSADLREALSRRTDAAREETRAAPVPEGPPTVPLARSNGTARATPQRLTRKPRLWVAIALVAAILVGGGTAVLLTRGNGPGTPSGDASLRTFVDRIENVLEQSSGGRLEIGNALAAGLNCTIPPREAGRRIASVANNRQSILDQLGSLQAPTQETADVVTLLQRALQQSIEADRHYRDAFFDVTRPGCPLPANPDFVLARRSDTQATSAKERFVRAFDPLARRLDRRTWLASEI